MLNCYKWGVCRTPDYQIQRKKKGELVKWIGSASEYNLKISGRPPLKGGSERNRKKKPSQWAKL